LNQAVGEAAVRTGGRVERSEAKEDKQNKAINYSKDSKSTLGL